MLFTLGNFITLGVVAVVLLVYRQLDRDNRSLERVKKYADRLRDELSAYVDKRSEDLQRYAIELDVQQKAAKEVLKRIQGVEEGLSARAEAISGIEGRLSEYDGALARLMQMTAAVDENLARLHEENEFTTSVNRKLEGAQKSLVVLEKEIPALREGFNRENAATIQSFKDGLLAEVGGRLETTLATLGKAEVEAQALLSRAEDGRRETERALAQAFQRARVEAEKLEDAAFEKLREASEAKAARLKETVDEKFHEIGQAAKDKAVETQALLKGLKAEWKAESEGLLAATRAEVGLAADDLGTRLDATETRLDEVEKSYEDKAERVERRAEEVLAALQDKAKVNLAAHKEEIERLVAESKARAETLGAEMAGLLKTAAAEAKTGLAGQRQEMERLGAESKARAETLAAELAAQLKATADGAKALTEAAALEAASRAQALAAEAKTRTEAAAAELAHITKTALEGAEAAARVQAKAGAELAKQAEAVELAAESLAALTRTRSEELEAATRARSEELETLSRTRRAELEAETKASYDAIEATAKARSEGLGRELAALGERLAAELQSRRAELEAELARQAAVLKADFAAHNEELEGRIGAAGAELEARVAGGFERRLGEYGSEIEAKFARLETVNVDIAALEAALREAMGQAERRVEGDFAAFQTAFQTRSARFEEGFGAQSAALRDSMKALETELDALKARAYENVSQKLKLFEDDFFADLKTRSEAVDARLEAWKADLERALADLAATTETERAAAEKAGLEEVRARLTETQARVAEQLEVMRGRVQDMADGIAAQGGMAQESLAALRDTVRQDAADARKTALAHVEGEIAQLGLLVETRLKTAEKGLGEGLSGLAAGIEAETQRLKTLREAGETAIASFKGEFKKGLEEADARLRAELAGFKATTLALAESLRGDYEAQRDGHLKQSQAERDRITKELTGLADRTAELRQDLSSRIREALEGFTRGQEAFSAELAKKQREAEAEAETRMRGFREAVQELGLKVEASRAQALGRVEAEAGRLSQVVAEIEKEQKAFIAQTKIFERSDELKASLAASIETMKEDLAKLDSRRAEIAEIETQLGRVKRLEDEVNQKVARFLAEKRRIDALEADFGRLSEVSQGVDRKLEEVTGASDALTEAQTRIRKILELSAEAEAKYDRLEKKAGILDTTAEAVDKNFQSTQAVEKLLSAYGAELKRLPDKINEIRKSVDELAQGKAKADEAAKKLGELDGILADAEKRIAEAMKAREWLARAETRLEEVNRQASEQLKLLSTLLKEEGGQAGRGGAGRGAPPSTVQDTVRKLSRQGWAPDEIARAVKISRGEVELILELGGKS